MGVVGRKEDYGDYNRLYDVIIAGGGTSGIPAAIAASRAGAKVLLVERTGCLGGQFSVSGPAGFCYAFFRNSRGQRDVGGFLWETYRRLFDSGHALPHFMPAVRANSGYTFAYVDPDWWTQLVFDMMDEEDVDLLLNTLVVDAILDGETIKGIVVENADGRVEIRGKIVIDCTGEAYLSQKAGVETVMLPEEGFPPHSVAFTVDGIDWDRFLAYVRNNPDQFSWREIQNDSVGNTRERIQKHYSTLTDIRQVGELVGFYELRDAALENGDWHPHTGAGMFFQPKEGGHMLAQMQHSSQVSDCPPTSAWHISHAIRECRRQNKIAWRFFKNYIPGFENSYISKMSQELRLREGPRIVGDYTFTREDVTEARIHPDVIGKSNFIADSQHVASMDTLNVIKSGKTLEKWPYHHGSYDIPYRVMVPKKIENLLAAGKHVSADSCVYLRYIQQTMVTGQAAGVAAAICARTGKTPRDLENDYGELQKTLLEQDAILFLPDPDSVEKIGHREED
ncbi:MAG: FAD-dependent oxidoreductase [Clostridiales bacterium]|nr:FAD-dependent oxidoreductase [Clostridiales bacterium]